jgi:hypothetical protein
MKRFIMALMTFSIVSPAFADIQALNEKTDELELEQEVEGIEQYGSDASAEETKRESERLSREARQLESDIARMKQANVRATEKQKNLQALYQKKAQLAVDVQKQAKIAAERKTKSESEVARLKGKVEAKEQRVIQLVEKRKASDNRIRELVQEKRTLEHRLLVAERNAKQNENRIRNSRARSLKLARENSRLGKRVARSEARASHTY